MRVMESKTRRNIEWKIPRGQWNRNVEVTGRAVVAETIPTDVLGPSNVLHVVGSKRKYSQTTKFVPDFVSARSIPRWILIVRCAPGDRSGVTAQFLAVEDDALPSPS